ncbi:MAG: hypothetical protein VCF08_24715 [Alphaproteobacteria bacterium]
MGKVDYSTALVTLFDVDMAAMGAMMADPEFHKLTENYVEEHVPYSNNPLNPAA